MTKAVWSLVFWALFDLHFREFPVANGTTFSSGASLKLWKSLTGNSNFHRGISGIFSGLVRISEI